MSTDEQTPVQKIEESKPPAWTPEDASRFLTSAIQEAQRPLAEQLRDRPITSRWLTIIVATMVIVALGVALILSSHLERAERTHSNQLQEVDKKLEAVRAAREEVLTEKLQYQASAATLEGRLAAVHEQSAQLQRQIDGMRGDEDELKRAKSDLQRFRRQNELLRSQISGLEMEKVALARQLDAVRAMALDDAENEALLPHGEENVDEDYPVAGLTPANGEPAAAASPSPAPAIETGKQPSANGVREPEAAGSLEDARIEHGAEPVGEGETGGAVKAIAVEEVADVVEEVPQEVVDTLEESREAMDDDDSAAANNTEDSGLSAME